MFHLFDHPHLDLTSFMGSISMHTATGDAASQQQNNLAVWKSKKPVGQRIKNTNMRAQIMEAWPS